MGAGGRCGAVIGFMLLASGLLGGAQPAAAAELAMGIAIEPDTVDPHFHWSSGSMALTFQMFEPLVDMAGNGTLRPGLAAAWKPLNDTDWEFDLRPGVKFQDGSPLTSADIAFTLKRARDVPNSPGGFGSFIRQIASVETPDERRVIIHTDGLAPLLPTFLSRIGVISEHAGKNATTEDYNTGKATIGTGPYRFVNWAHGDAITLKRNDFYWGKPPAWDKVTLRYIKNAASRVAALLAGDVDLIDSVSVEDVARLKQDARLRVREAPALTVIGMQLDVAQRKPPFISGPDGSPLETNPLTDLRVRQALALAVNHEALVSRVLNGQAAIATQLMGQGQFGYDPALKPIGYDPGQAKRLLAEAGYPHGLRMTIQCQSDQYPNGVGVCQALAQMFGRIGVQTTPELVPHNMFVTRSNDFLYSVFDMSVPNDTGEPSQTLVFRLASKDAAKGWGGLNRGRYSNPALDRLLDEAAREVDARQREATLRKAGDITVTDVAWIPLFRPLNIVAMRRGLDDEAREDGFVLAAEVHPAGGEMAP